MQRRFVAAYVAVLSLMISSSQVSAQTAPPGRGKPAAVTAPSGPSANEKAAREAFERGRVFYDAGAFDQASSSFEEAHRLSGRDQLLYNIYLAYRDANQPAKAADALRGFLAKVPNIENRAQLEARLAALDAGLSRERERQAQTQAQQQAAPVAAPPAVATEAPRVPLEENEHAPRSKRFWAGVSLAALGGAMMLTSIGTGVVAHNHAQQLADDCPGKVCRPSLESTADSGKTLAHATDGLLFGGLAVAAGGAALLFLFGGLERDRSAPPPVTAACSFTGCVAQTTLRF
ncbi:MAG: hypothetical protein JWN48_2606 [Myxococcaceae bacterium]|nr:hypothetical protein [Myxococcaceae bacterium]